MFIKYSNGTTYIGYCPGTAEASETMDTMHACTYVPKYVCIYMYIYVYYIHMYLLIYVYLCIYIYI